MRYQVQGLEIRSENAAKPACAAGRWMLDRISKLDPRGKALDLGCGKLRYTVHLAERIPAVTAVDSAAQVDRKQMLFQDLCSVRDYARNYLPNVRVCSLDEEAWRQDQYSVVLCSNVLSAIPFRKIRRELVAIAFERMCPGGQFLLTTQYRNSHFTSWRDNPNARELLDGYLVRGPRGTSFYGLIDSAALTQLCRSAGFSILDAGHVKELAYVSATRI